MKRIHLILLMYLFWQMTAIAEIKKEPVEVLLGRYGWGLNLGGEFPGAKSQKADYEDPDHGYGVRVDYDFTGGGRYLGVQLSEVIEEADELSFWFKGAGGLIRIKDSTGQWLCCHFGGSGKDEWVHVKVPLTAERFAEAHWGGAGDGKFHFPINLMLIGVDRYENKLKNSFILSGIAVTVPSAKPQTGWFIKFKSKVPAGVALVGEKVSYEILLENRVGKSRRGQVKLQITDDAGKIKNQEWPVDIKPFGTVVKKIDMDTSQVSYQYLKVSLTVDRKVVREKDWGFCVLRKPYKFGQPDKEAFYGFLGAGINNDAAERIGGKADRYHLAWGHVEKKDGKYNFGPWDAVSTHHMNILFTIELTPNPDYACWKNSPFPGMRGFPDPKRLSEFRDFVKAAVEYYKGKITVMELNNEPDLGVWRGQGIDVDKAAELYVMYLKAAYEGAKAADPHVIFGAPGVSGGELEPGQFQFIERVFAKGAKYIDCLPIHPYASPRYFGPGQFPHWPEGHQVAKNIMETQKLARKYNIPPRVFIGEFGWAYDPKSKPLDGISLDYAACTAQGLITVLTVPGVEKCLMFCMPPYPESGYDYGVFRDDPEIARTSHIGPCEYPIPAANYYSTCAYMLHHAKVVRQIPLGATLRAWRFDRADDKFTVVPIWTREGSLRLTATVPASTTAVNSFGREIANGSKLNLIVGVAPLFLAVPIGEGEALVKGLEESTIFAEKPVTIRNAFFPSADKLRVELINHLRKPVRTILQDGKDKKEFMMEPGNRIVDLVPPSGDKQVTVIVQADGKSQSLSMPMEFLPINRLEKVVIDGKLDETAGLQELQMKERKDILPPDPNIGWNGPEDLSIRAWMGWTDKVLYFAARIRDDIHVVEDDGMNFWNYDSIQFAIDPDNDTPGSNYDAEDRELGFVLGKNGPIAYYTYPEGKVLPCDIKAFREKDETVYEVAIPWESLNMKVPPAGKIMAINFIANENDGQGRTCWMGLTPGIGESKTPPAFKKFVLVGEKR